jgi:hypothetical protein
MTLVFAAAAIALAAYLFFRKLRPARVAVPSLMLWTRVLADPREITLWDRIRRAVSLVVTCAIAGALAFAIGDPRRAGSSSEGDGTRTLIVIDSSSSMLARARGGTRWDRAIGEARRLAAVAGGEVAIATTSDGLVEGPTVDRALLDAALDRLSPGGPAGPWPELDEANSVHFITDGGTPKPNDAEVTLHSVYEAASNVAITAFEVRERGDERSEIYLEATNYGPRRQTRISVRRGDNTILDRTIAIEDGQSLRHVIPIPTAGEPRLTARVEADDDALAIDNEAFAWAAAADPIAVTVVGPQTGWLSRLLMQNPRVQARFVAPADYRAGDADVVIFDEWTPTAAPDVPALLIHPPTDEVVQEPRWVAGASHPVLRGVDPLTLSISRASAYVRADLMPIATSTSNQTLVAIRDTPSMPREVVVSFGARGSNLAEAPGFPVLIGNALDWLTGRDDAVVRRIGSAVFDRSVERVTDPAGAHLPLLSLPQQQVAALRTPGFYSVDRRGARTVFAVNAGDPQISNLRHAPAGNVSGATAVAAALRTRPWWIYLAAFAFMAAAVEWWTWLRRITV